MIRLKLVFFSLLLAYLLIIHRLFVIQIINPNKILPLQKYIQLNRQPPLRGEIYDKNGKPLVLNRKVYDVYVNTDAARANKKIQQVLIKELKIKQASLSAVLQLGQWRKIKSKVKEEQKEKLSSFYPNYLNFEAEWERFYPEGSSSAQILGFVGRDETGQPKGYLGIEGYFDQELRGLPSIAENESDFLGIPFISGIFSGVKNREGLDIYLTIDVNVQKIVEQELYRGVEYYRAKKGCAIVIEPASGKLIALSCVPGFDPQRYFQYQDEDFINPLISSVYEPGSTFKPLIVAVGLEEGKISPQSVFAEKGPIKIGQYTIRTWNDEYHGRITLSEVLERSSNVGMVQIIQKLKRNKVNQYLKDFGLREMTNIELEGETNSLLKDVEDWYDIDFATISFGQGLAVTPLQLTRAFSVLANDGYLIEPTIVERIVDKRNQQLIPLKNKSKQRVLSKKTMRTMRELLYNTVENSEAKWTNKPEGYKFCGKTGTAQIPIAGHYDPAKTIASFIGFLPCEEAKFLLLVLYREPEASPWGSETAAPTFFEIAKSLILYYNIPPNL